MQVSVKIAKLDDVVTFDVESLPAASLAYAITYGLTQAINDAHASVTAKNFKGTDAEFLAAVREKTDKRIAQIESGNVPGTRAPADPNLKKAKELAAMMADDAELAEIVEAEMAKRKLAKAA